MRTFQRIVLIVLAVVCLLVASQVLNIVDAGRDIYESRSISGTEPTDPAIVLLTHLLGGFKGLLVDAIWLRAVKLQLEGKFWELYQLYDLMGKLQPHMEEIWVFNGWNMAYNLVAELQDDEARWQWIQRGIELLRDEGLKYNPHSGKILQQIAWTFGHKMGRDVDLHSHYYKHRWALIMHHVVGPKRIQDVRGMAEAPTKLEDFLKDPDVAPVLGSIDPALLKQLTEVKYMLAVPDPIKDAISRNEKAERKLISFVAATILRRDYKMTELNAMVAIEDQFGKFDWRLPEPHALYWATLALDASDRSQNRQIHYDRILLYALQETMRRGIIAYLSPNPKEPMNTAFDLGKIKYLDQLYERLLEKYGVDERDPQYEHASYYSLRDGHIQLLEEAAFNLYFAGYYTEALKYHHKLRELYLKPDPYMELNDYVLKQVKELVDLHGTMAKVRAFVDSLMYQTCFLLCTNNPDQARTMEELAKRAWAAYLQYDEAHVTTRHVDSSKLPTWKEVLRDNVRVILSGRTSFPPQLIPVLRRILNLPKDWEKEEKFLHGTDLSPRLDTTSPEPK